MARVENAAGAGALGRIDCRGIRVECTSAADSGRDDEHLVGVLEGVVEGARVGEVACSQAHACIRLSCLCKIAFGKLVVPDEKYIAAKSSSVSLMSGDALEQSAVS